MEPPRAHGAHQASYSPALPSSIPVSTTESVDQYLPVEYEVQNPAVLAAFMIVIILVGIVANVVAIVTVWRVDQYRRSRDRHSSKMTIANFLIRCLMVVDLVSLVVYITRRMFYELMSTSLKCYFLSVTNNFFSFSSGFVNAVMCFDRSVALLVPFFYHRNATLGQAQIAVVIVIVIAFLLSMLPVFGFGSYEATINGTVYCIGPGDLEVNASEHDFEFAVVFLVTGITIIFFIHACNAVVITQIVKLARRGTAWRPPPIRVPFNHEKSRRRMSSEETPAGVQDVSSAEITTNYDETMSGQTISAEENADANDRKTSEAKGSQYLHRYRVKQPRRTEVEVAKQIVVVSVVFTISWMPFYIQRTLKATGLEQPQWYLIIVIILLTSNHVVDPFVFVFMKRQSRVALRELCCGRVCCRSHCTTADMETNSSTSSKNPHPLVDAKTDDEGAL